MDEGQVIQGCEVGGRGFGRTVGIIAGFETREGV